MPNVIHAKDDIVQAATYYCSFLARDRIMLSALALWYRPYVCPSVCWRVDQSKRL